MASYDCGSMNWLNTGLFLNPPAFLEQLGKDFQEWGVKPEIEAFDPGMIANAAYYLKKGVLKAPLHFQFCMGCANGIPGSIKNLLFMKETMDTLCPGSTWSCFGVGQTAMDMLYAAVALGGRHPGRHGGQRDVLQGRAGQEQPPVCGARRPRHPRVWL